MSSAPRILLDVQRATVHRSGTGEGLVLLLEIRNQSGHTFARSTLTAQLYDASGRPLVEVATPAGAVAPGEQVITIPLAATTASRAVHTVECRLECVLTSWATTVRHITAHQEAPRPAASSPPPAPSPEVRGLLPDEGRVIDLSDEDVVVEPPPQDAPRRAAPWETSAAGHSRSPESTRSTGSAGSGGGSGGRGATAAGATPRAEPVRETEAPWVRAARRNAEATGQRAAREERLAALQAAQDAARAARGPDPDDPWAMLDSGDRAAAERLFLAQRLDSAGASRVRELLSSRDVEQVVLGCTISWWTRWSAPILLRPLLRHADPRVRAAAVAALGVVAGPSLLNDVSPLMQDADPQVQAAAVLAVAQMRGTAPRR